MSWKNGIPRESPLNFEEVAAPKELVCGWEAGPFASLSFSAPSLPPSLPRNPAQKWRLRKSENIRGWGKRRRERGRRGGRRRLFLFFTPDMCSCLCAGGREEEKKKNIVHHFLGKEAGRKGKKKGGGGGLVKFAPEVHRRRRKKKGGKNRPRRSRAFYPLGELFYGRRPPKKNFLRRKRNGV